jgi:hypothetical protein
MASILIQGNILLGSFTGGTSTVPTWVTPSGSLGSLNEGSAGSFSVMATPSAGTVVYSVQSGTLPPGLTLNANTGAITGTASLVSADTTSVFVIRATDDGGFADRSFSITVLNSLSVITWVTPAGSLGTQGQTMLTNYQVSATVTGGETVSYSVTSGTLPPGASLNSSTGAITGPTVSVATDTTYTFTIQALSSPSLTTLSRTFSITVVVNLAPFWVTPTGMIGTYSGTGTVNETFIAHDPDSGYTAITYTVQSGALPAGVTLNSSTGQLTGTVTASAGTYNFTIRASDGTAFSDRAFSIVVT